MLPKEVWGRNRMVDSFSGHRQVTVFVVFTLSHLLRGIVFVPPCGKATQRTGHPLRHIFFIPLLVDFRPLSQVFSESVIKPFFDHRTFKGHDFLEHRIFMEINLPFKDHEIWYRGADMARSHCPEIRCHHMWGQRAHSTNSPNSQFVAPLLDHLLFEGPA